MNKELFRTLWNNFYNENKIMLETMEDSDMCFAFLEWSERNKNNGI